MDSLRTLYFLKEFEPLVHKSLSKLNISQRDRDYDDFFQELQIKLLKIIEKFECDSPDIDEKRYKFVFYAGQGLYWHGLELLRIRNNRHFDLIENDQLEWFAHQDISDDEALTSTLQTEEFFELAKERLSDKEYSLLLKLAEGSYTMQELADAYEVSRTTIYKWRDKIQTRLQDIRDCL